MMIKVFGTPAPKGSMKCVGNRRGFHQLVEDNRKAATPWKTKITKAGQLAVTKHGRLSGPLIADLTFTLPRPKSVPLRLREWPAVKGSGDVDKLARLVLDALDAADLFDDDAQVVHVGSDKCYPDTPGATDRLDRPGAIIRIESVTP